MSDTGTVRLAEPRQTVQIRLPDGRTFEGALGTTVEEFLRVAYPAPPLLIVAALVDGTLRELTYALQRDCTVEPLDLSTSDGERIYRRTLTFLLVVAAHRLFPEAELFVDHSLPFGGYFCEIRNRPPLTREELDALSQEMQRLIEANLPILREELPLEEAVEIFRQHGARDKAALFQGRNSDQKPLLRMYNLDGYRDYFHGYMVPSTGYLRYFNLMRWGDGIVLQFPRRQQPTRLQPPMPSPQLLTVFREYGEWLRRLDFENLSDLNAAVDAGRLREVILISEALHEHRVSEIANQIWERRGEVRAILIAGPSSSGKTTFSKRLAIQLLAQGLRPFALELDNYFVNREQTPRDEKGDYDFEALEALDLALLNEHLQALLRGEAVQLPSFNFQLGCREPGPTVQLSSRHILIMEGIHGLNPKLVYGLNPRQTFRIYVSALTQLNLDRHNRVPTTDTRLIRRIVRDARTRGYNATQTLSRWESVRRGERRHIFPFQENADVMFNSALVYELAVLKAFAEPLLLQVEPELRQRVEAKRLLAFLQWFHPADASLVPENSILREFIGGLTLEKFRWD